MEIRYLGHSSFLIKTKSASLITDPYDSDSVGLKFPKHTECDLVTVSHDHKDHNAFDQIEGKPFRIWSPGEYEVKGISVIGIPAYHDSSSGQDRGGNVIYRIEADNLNLLHLGDLGHELSEEEIELIDGIDILFVPIGGIYTIDCSQAKKVVNEIEPTIIIPMHYKTESHNATFKDLQKPEDFFKEMGVNAVEPVNKLNITKDKLPETRQIVLFS